MKEKLNVRVDTIDGRGDVQSIDVNRDLTLICHQGMLEVTAMDDDVATITAEDTVARAKALTLAQWDELRQIPRFIDLFKRVFDAEPPKDLTATTVDVRHVVGMIVLILEAIAEGKVPFLKLPETYLHPRHQCGIADMLASMTKDGDEQDQATV